MKKYLCKRTCFFQRLYRKGEIDTFADNVDVPEHFEFIEDIKNIVVDAGNSTQGLGDITNNVNNQNSNNLPTGGGNVDEEELYLLLEEKTIAELKKYAADETIELGTANKKADIIKLIVAAKVYGAELTDEVPKNNEPDPEG